MVCGGGGARCRDGRGAFAGGVRVITARDFFSGIMTTALRDDELLDEVRLPLLPAVRLGFCEFSRRAAISPLRWRW